MAALVLMARNSERMNVPVSKLDDYLAQGWREISRVEMAESRVSTETREDVEPAPKAEKPKGKGK